MAIYNQDKGKSCAYTVEELAEAARDLRALCLTGIYAGGSGHPGGSLSCADIAVSLFLNVANLCPTDPQWVKRDRIFFSAGHKAPALYAGLGLAGFFDPDEIATLRSLGSPFQGHPHKGPVKGLEVSSGSLGQGLGIAVGNALALRADGNTSRVFCLMGDGEQQEGSIWEAVMMAGHSKLGNLCAIVDKNRLQIDGSVEEVLGVDPLDEKYKAFRWNVITIDGHSLPEILSAFREAEKVKDKPTLIIANTVKGKGVSYMEDQAGWHGIAPRNPEEFEKALREIGSKRYTLKKAKELLERAKKFQLESSDRVRRGMPGFSQDFFWNKQDLMKASMVSTREGFGKGLKKAGEDPRVVTLHADISGSIKITDFEKDNPERKGRVFSVGIAEQNMMSVAAGLALSGKIPVTGTYGVFAAGRPWDQIRTTICYDNLNVKIAGAHGGISVGPDGATHQALEEISLMAVLPNMTLMVPCDSLETERLTLEALLAIHGPCYIRFARESTPVVTKADTPMVFGKANVIRFRQEKPDFIEAFETRLASEYRNEGETITLVACGPMVPEAMRAAWILKKEAGIEARILNCHTLKPLDKESLVRAALETGNLLVCEEHQTGGFGNIVAGAVLSADLKKQVGFSMLGVEDRFGESGQPWDLMMAFGLTAEFIAERALGMLKKG